MLQTVAPVEMGARRGASWGFFGAAWRAPMELIWSAALLRVFKTRPCIPASSPAGACATPLLAEAIVRRTGALVVLGAASVLVPLLVLFPSVQELKLGVLAAHGIVLLGCACVLLSPAHRAVADLARRAAEAAREIFGVPRRAVAEPWYETAGAVRRTGALVGVFKPSPCSSASSPAGARATPLLTEATVRRAGALLALGAASVLVPLLFSQPDDLKHGVLAAYAIFLLGCAGVLLSPEHRAVAELVLRAAEAAGEIFVAPWRAAAEPCYETAAAVRRTGALVALAAASKLLLLLMPVPAVVASKNINGVVLALYFVFLLGCSAVLLSPAHPAIANLARRAAEAARKNLHATGRTNAVLRWAGFTCICIVFSTTCAVGSVRAEAAAAVTVVSSPEQFGILVLFLLFLVGVWAVSLSMVTGRGPPTLPVRLPLPLQPPAEDEHGACGPRSDSVNTREQRQHEEQTTCHL